MIKKSYQFEVINLIFDRGLVLYPLIRGGPSSILYVLYVMDHATLLHHAARDKY